MLRKARNYIEREVAALKLRVGVKHNWNVDCIGNRTKIRFDLCVLEREVGLENCQNSVGTELLVRLRLLDCICRGGRCHTRDHRHFFRRRFDRRLHHRFTLRTVEVCKLAGRTERRQPVHAGLDQVGR